MSHDPKKFLYVLAAANEKMDLQVKVHHNQKHQIYRQISHESRDKFSAAHSSKF